MQAEWGQRQLRQALMKDLRFSPSMVCSLLSSELQICRFQERHRGITRMVVSLGNNNTAEAESHFRKAVKQWPKYWAAWVVLGQLLAAQQKTKEADDACSQPLARRLVTCQPIFASPIFLHAQRTGITFCRSAIAPWQLIPALRWSTTITRPRISSLTICQQRKKARCGLPNSTRTTPTSRPLLVGSNL